MIATATAAKTARTVAATAAATQPRKRGRPKGSKGKELRGRRLLVVVILRPLATKKASMPTVHSFQGFKIAQMYIIGFDISSMAGG
jgi:hypothetical protein